MIKINMNIKDFFLIFNHFKADWQLLFLVYNKCLLSFLLNETLLGNIFCCNYFTFSHPFLILNYCGTEMFPNGSENDGPIINLEVGFISNKLICDTASKQTFWVRGGCVSSMGNTLIHHVHP